MAGGGEGAFTYVFFGDKEAGAGWLLSVLGAVGEEGLETLLCEWRDVDDEGGADVGVEGGVEDLVGAVGCVSARGFDFGEAADEAGLVAEGGGGVVVGVAALPVGEDHDSWA